MLSIIKQIGTSLLGLQLLASPSHSHQTHSEEQNFQAVQSEAMQDSDSSVQEISTPFKQQEPDSSSSGIPTDIDKLLSDYRDQVKNLTGTKKYKYALAKLAPGDFYKLFIDQQRLKEYHGENPHLLFDTSPDNHGSVPELGYYEAMMGAFKYIGKTIDHPVNIQYLIKLHDLAVRRVKKSSGGCITQGIVAGAYYGVVIDKITQEGRSDWDKYKLICEGTFEDHPEYLSRVSKIDEQLGPVVRVHSNLLCLCSSPSYVDDSQTAFLAAKDRLNPILIDYYNRIQKSSSIDETLEAISILIRSIEIFHMFADGNGRTSYFLLLNKVLVENNFPMVILEWPWIFDGYKGTNEIVADLKQGMINFLKVANRL